MACFQMLSIHSFHPGSTVGLSSEAGPTWMCEASSSLAMVSMPESVGLARLLARLLRTLGPGARTITVPSASSWV